MVNRQCWNTFAGFRLEAVAVACSIFLLLVGNRATAGTGDRHESEREGVESQTREFAVSVDGTKRGTCRMQIRSRDDGTVWVRSQAELRMNFIVYKYNYLSVGTEVWKSGRLISLENTANYNGTRYLVKASPTRSGLQLTVDGAASPLDADVWVSSYWHIPERFTSALSGERNANVPAPLVDRDGRPVCLVSLLDSDQGKKLHGKLKRVGRETLEVMGTQKTCTHYRITGDVQVDLWYDAVGCLVRQESQESSHKARLELTRITAE